MNETDFEKDDKKIRTDFCELYNEILKEPMSREQIQQLCDLKILNLDYITNLTIKMMIWKFKPDFILQYTEMEKRNVKLKEILLKNDE